ncbi:MAG: type III-A CRISPR-associated protein Cas10/Csm1, partial [Dehalococcoidales bacterium]|nr:type III-A CRISPR-associated protein Cas10/Csm1 [Dehalococcoidales bacterium]
MEYRTVLLAAFLHDIGKLLGRGSFQDIDKGQHPKFSADFISSFRDVFANIADADLLKELVQKHHQNRRAFPDEYLVESIQDSHQRALATLISQADNLSSAERSENSDRYQDYKTTPLASVIQRLDNPDDRDLNLKFHPVPLPAFISREQGQKLFPVEYDKYQPGEMNNLIKAFGTSFKQYVDSLPSVDYVSFVQHLTSLVLSHTWCIPSNTQEAVPDISLFDHLKTTAAIAACLYQHHQKNGLLSLKDINNPATNRFIIAAGDISGIQSYIFDIPTSASKGTARQLRARSLFIQLCSEVAAHQILHRMQLPDWNIIISSGGNFYLLLPNLPETVMAIQETQERIDSWLINHRNGELSLNLAWQAFGDTGFKSGSPDELQCGFSSVIQQVKDRLNQKKQNRYSSLLQDPTGWKNTGFILPVSFSGSLLCDSCKKYPAAPGTGSCPRCSQESEIGSRLPETQYIAFYPDGRSGSLNIFDYSIEISETPEFAGSPYLVEKLNNPDLLDVSRYPASLKYLATHVGRNENRILTFEDMAELADGRKLLGFFKADVDNLGRMLAFGLKRQNNSLDTISRQTTFSRLMDSFFTGYIDSLVTDEYQECYTVYSGGDDLFFVGPWDKVLSLAEQINQDFRKFAGNTGLSLSAGLSFARANYPVARAAEMAEQALEAAKDRGRNRLTLLGNTLTWEEWAGVKKDWYYLQNLLDKYQTASAFSYNLFKMAMLWKRYRGGDTLGLRYHPLLAYNIKRNLDERRMPELYSWTDRLLSWPPVENTRNI